MDGWMGGWVGGWVGVKAVLRIAYSNQKSKFMQSSSKDADSNSGQLFRKKSIVDNCNQVS
jgi:hypothetical protein